MKNISQKIFAFAQKPTDILTFTAVFLGLVFLRVFVEQFLAKAHPRTFSEMFIEYSHDIFFFSLVFIFLWILTATLLRKRLVKLSFLFLCGLWLILFPPILDMLKTRGSVFWSFYILSDVRDLPRHFFTFFGDLPSGIAYFGTKITFSLVLFLLATFVFIKTKDYLRTLGAVLGAYAILFFMGAFPTFFFLIYSFFSKAYAPKDVKAYQIAQFFGTSQKIFGLSAKNFTYNFAYNLNLIFFPFLALVLFLFFFLWNREKFLSILKNLRLPQIVYHSGLFFIGVGLGILNFPKNLNISVFSISAFLCLLFSVWFSWIASIIINDIYDFKIDSISNPERPLVRKIFSQENYSRLGVFSFLLAILGAATVGFSFAALIITYQILAFLYSAPPFRLKKFPLVATFFSSCASLMILFLGYILISSDQTIAHLSWRIIALLGITYTISLPIKDFKDILGDKKYGIWTLPVLLGEKKARLVVAINLFVSYMLSVFLLNELGLFFWALLFGGFTFLVITSPKIKPRQLFWPVLGLVAIYGLILTKITLL